MDEPMKKCKQSDATMRAIQRVAAGERPTHAAREEGINPSTLFRALAKEWPPKVYLVIDKKPEGFDAWIEDQNYKQRVPDVTYASVADLQAALPGLLAKCWDIAHCCNGRSDFVAMYARAREDQAGTLADEILDIQRPEGMLEKITAAQVDMALECAKWGIDPM